MKRNFQKELDDILLNHREKEEVPKLLLHSCCAPCSSYVLEYLSHYFSISILYYNPNISPREEYFKRKAEQIRLIESYNRDNVASNHISFLDCDYQPNDFYNNVKGLESCKEGGERCFVCYELRLRRAAAEAVKGGFDYFASTLSISPLKNAEKLNEIGESIAAEYQKSNIRNICGQFVKHLPNDFKKREGYKRSITLSKEYGLYRQDYCGCVYSRINTSDMKKSALFVGGTGVISSAITKMLSEMPQWQLFLINRGNNNADLPSNVKTIVADIRDYNDVAAKLNDMTFDVVVDFICFDKSDAERDYKLFNGRTKQFIFISTASAYQKPPKSEVVNELTPLENPFWDYSQKKIECEKYFWERYAKDGFPLTVVRPSHTFSEKKIPVGVHGKKGSWQVIKRMLDGKPIIVHDDGKARWTMTFNEDFAQGFVPLMGSENTLGEAIQITSDESFTWNEIYSILADVLGVEYKPCYVPSERIESTFPSTKGSLLGDKACSVIFDNSKLKRFAPDMKMTIGMKEGMRRAYAYLLSHPQLQVEDPEFDSWCDGVVESPESRV